MALLAFAPLMFADPAHAAVVPAKITCSDSLGNTGSWNVQWNNENQYFSDKGNIAAHFCEGGFAGSFTNFVSVVGANGDELEPSLLYFNGIIPEPEPPAPPIQTTEDVERVTEEVVREPETPEIEPPAEEVTEQPEEVAPVTPEPPVSQPEPVIPLPEPEPTPEEPVSPVEPTEPPVEESVQPEPVKPSVPPVEPEISPELPVQPEPEVTQEPQAPSSTIGGAISEAFNSAIEGVTAAIEAFQTAGLDMTEEERKTAQSAVIPSVMVALVATTSMIRK